MRKYAFLCLVLLAACAGYEYDIDLSCDINKLDWGLNYETNIQRFSCLEKDKIFHISCDPKTVQMINPIILCSTFDRQSVRITETGKMDFSN